MNFGYAFCACINADDLAPGLSCVELNGSCDYSIDSSSILYKNIKQLWHGNVLAARSSGSCNIPDVTVTPIESTCCSALGGPDIDANNQCDYDPNIYVNAGWNRLGFRVAVEQPFVYQIAGDAIFVIADDDCDGWQERLIINLSDYRNLNNCTWTTPQNISFNYEWALNVTVALNSSQQQEFDMGCSVDADCLDIVTDNTSWSLPNGVSTACSADNICSYALNTTHEIYGNLKHLWQGNILAARSSGTCEIPDITINPIEATCCPALGGPDTDYNELCDADPLIWLTPSWLRLGFAIPGEHEYVYMVANDEIQAISDRYCDATKEILAINLSDYLIQESCGWQSLDAIEYKYGNTNLFNISLTLAQEPDFSVACSQDSDCFDIIDNASWFLSPGISAACGANNVCSYALNDSSEIYKNLKHLWQANVMAAKSSGSCDIPDASFRPVEYTCCNALGGPDINGNNLCDHDPAIWTDWWWMRLGFILEGEHAYVYGVQNDGISAFNDVYCDGTLDGFVINLTEYVNQGSCNWTNLDHVEYFSGSNKLFNISLTSGQQSEFSVACAQDSDCDGIVGQGWFMPPGVNASCEEADSICSYELQTGTEVKANLEDLYLGFMESTQSSGNCSPPSNQVTPVEATCCAALGGPDIDLNNMCDVDVSVWNQSGWNQMNFSINNEHSYVYSVLNGEINAISDVYCDGEIETVMINTSEFERASCQYIIPTLVKYNYGSNFLFNVRSGFANAGYY